MISPFIPADAGQKVCFFAYFFLTVIIKYDIIPSL